jgi:branched-chain amino acid transport system permease protein
MDQFLNQIVNSLNVGSIYALIALGYTMVYGIVKLINFAHGEILMIGAFVGYFLATAFNMSLIPLLILSMLACAIIGVTIDRVAYKPLRNAPRISALITALGMSMFLSNFFKWQFGASDKIMPDVNLIGDIPMPNITLITVIITVVCMIGLEFIVSHTKVGKAMRSVSEDRDAARLMGVNVDKTISLTFAIGSALGAVGGVLYALNYGNLEPYMGMMPGLKAFVAAVLGGIGIIPGAMVGGFAIGIIETFVKGYISSSWANVFVFGILIIVLLVKPTGLFGKNVKEKV